MDKPQLDQISQFIQIFNFQKIIAFIVALVFLVFLVKMFSILMDRLEKAFPSRRLLFSQAETIISFFAYIFGTNFLFFSIIRPPNELLLAAGGSIAVAVGLSLKDLVASIIAGLILLFDRPFQVGDRVSFEGFYGEIRSIGLRAVRLNTLDDNLVTIPNSKFITDAVSCGNAGALDMMIVVKFHFDLHVDIQKVSSLLRDIISTSNYVYLKKPIKILVQEEIIGGRPIIIITGKFYVLDVKYEKTIESDIYYRANRAFSEMPRPKPVLGPMEA